MIVAIVDENENVMVNEYPYIKSVDEIKSDFVDDFLMIELDEKPEEKEGYQLKYNGFEFYYEEIVNLESEPDVWAEMAQAIAEGVNDIE